MATKKFTREEILEAIYEKFDTLEELAAKIGGTKQGISDKITRQSPKFLKLLKSVGIEIKKSDLTFYAEQKGSKNIQGDKNKINEYPEPYALEEKVKFYQEIIQHLKEIINQKDKRILELSGGEDEGKTKK